MTSRATDTASRERWRDLGFFYELDRDLQQWRLVGSRSGLLRFRDALIEYATTSDAAAEPTAVRLGPRSNLEIAIWADPGIDASGIFGSPDDLRHLAATLERKLSGALPGNHIRVGREFAPESTYVLALDLRADGFDPASADPALREDG